MHCTLVILIFFFLNLHCKLVLCTVHLYTSFQDSTLFVNCKLVSCTIHLYFESFVNWFSVLYTWFLYWFYALYTCNFNLFFLKFGFRFCVWFVSNGNILLCVWLWAVCLSCSYLVCLYISVSISSELVRPLDWVAPICFILKFILYFCFVHCLW